MSTKVLKQNNLAEGTTENGFCDVINTNVNETIVKLAKEVTLDSGETVIVEGITPDRMKQVLNSQTTGSDTEITFNTPGEPTGYKGNGEYSLGGVVQVYNINAGTNGLVSIEMDTLPSTTKYMFASFEVNMPQTLKVDDGKIKAKYSDGTEEIIDITLEMCSTDKVLGTMEPGTDITVSYTDSYGITKTTTFAIEVEVIGPPNP